MSDWDSDEDKANPTSLFVQRKEGDVGDIYEEKGFFFRQRRGRFNLRKLDQIQLDRLIREVDVQTLQEHLEDLTFSIFNEDDLQFYTDRQVVKLFRLAQLTIEYLLYSQGQLVTNLHELSTKYSTKKKSLHRKRRELTGLKEEVDSLYSQLKLKRKNLATLEKMVKDGGKASKPSEEKKEQEIIRFFVSLPNNLFMELEERPSTSIRNVISQAMNVILKDPNFDPSLSLPSDSLSDSATPLQLLCKGKLLLLDSTLEQCNIRSGDTLVASFQAQKKKARAPSSAPTQDPPRVVETKSDSESKLIMQGLNDMLNRQLKSIEQLAAEMSNCTNALQNMANQDRTIVQKLDDTKLIEHMDDKLLRIEQEIKDNLDKVQLVQEMQSSRSKLVFGELENDADDMSGAIKELNVQIRQSFTQMTTISGQVNDTSSAIGRIAEALKTQQEELNELRKSLQSQKTSPRSPQVSFIVAEKETIAPKTNKWNFVIEDNNKASAGAVTLPVTKQEKVEEIVQTFEFVPKKKEEPVQVSKEPAELPKAIVMPVIEVKPEPVVEVKPKAEPKPVVVEKPPTPKNVNVVFTMEHNTDLLSVNMVKVAASLEQGLAADEIIFALRKAIASKVALPFSAVSLVLDKKLIKLGVDVPKSLPFSVQDVQAYVESGRLALRLQKPKTVSDAQIDALLVPVWQNDYKQNKASIESLKEMEPEDENVKKAIEGYDTVRLSLDGMLRELNEKAGLTDDELVKKKADLDAYSSASDGEQLKKHRSSIVGAVGTVYTSDSGPETARRSAGNLLRSSMTSLSGTMTSQGSFTLRGSNADLTPLLRLKSSTVNTDNAEMMEGDGSLSASRQSITMRRSWEQAADMDFYDDDVPMISSLSQPLRMNNPAMTSSGSSASRQRYHSDSLSNTMRSVDDATPSYISSVGDETMNTAGRSMQSKREWDDGKRGSFPSDRQVRSMIADNKNYDDKSQYDDNSYDDSYSQERMSNTNVSTLTSALPDSLLLSQTIDSEGEMLGRRMGSKAVDPASVQRRADNYERQAAQEMHLGVTDYANDGDDVTSVTSPFKDFGRYGSSSKEQGHVQDLDTASVHSLALSDSNNQED